MPCLVIVICDKLLGDSLQTIEKGTKIRLSQKGTHKIRLHVKGSGMIAQMIKKLVKDVKSEQKIDSNINNESILKILKKFQFIVDKIKKSLYLGINWQ